MAFTVGSLSDRVVVLDYFTELIGLDHWKGMVNTYRYISQLIVIKEKKNVFFVHFQTFLLISAVKSLKKV